MGPIMSNILLLSGIRCGVDAENNRPATDSRTPGLVFPETSGNLARKPGYGLGKFPAQLLVVYLIRSFVLRKEKPPLSGKTLGSSCPSGISLKTGENQLQRFPSILRRCKALADKPPAIRPLLRERQCRMGPVIKLVFPGKNVHLSGTDLGTAVFSPLFLLRLLPQAWLHIG
jgi:hypothetical protein